MPTACAPMSLVTYEDARPVGAGHQDADRPAARSAGVDAAVVRREEHRHPEVQERSVAERRRDRRRSRSGPTAARRAAIRPTCRRPIEFDETDRVDDRRTGSRAASRRTSRCRPSAPTGGATSASCRPASPKIAMSQSVEVREVNDIPKGGGDQHGRRTLRVPPHDVFERASQGETSRVGADEGGTAAGRFTKSAATPTSFRPKPAGCSRPTPSLTLSAGHICTRTATRRQAHLEFGVQVLPEGLQADLPPLERCGSATASTST